jgi:hypothetical protein
MNEAPQFNLDGTKYAQAYGYGYLASLMENVAFNAKMAKEFPQSADHYLDEIIKAKEIVAALRKAVDAATHL